MIIHLDADAFFASVEQAEDYRLLGRAMAVGGQRRGIIASASYEARKRGVYTPMPTARALQVCPELIVVPGNFSKYRRYSSRIFALAGDYTPWIEQCSIDEGFFDMSGNRNIGAFEAARELQARIFEELKITVSLGIGSNKLVAQIASKLRKPNALVEVPAGTEREFLAPLESHWLPGVGAKLGQRMREVGLTHVWQVASAPMEFLAQVAGNHAEQLQQYAMGIDPRPVVCERADPKSFGMQETFEDNVSDHGFVLDLLRTMADQLMAKVRAEAKAVRTLTVRLRYKDMSDATHAMTLVEATDLETDVYPHLPALLEAVWKKRLPVRLAGLRLSGVVEPVVQPELLLDNGARRRAKQHEAAKILDQLRAKALPLTRGHSVQKPEAGNRKPNRP